MAGQEPATKLRQRYSAEYKIAIGKRVIAGENVKALAKETGVTRGMLYNWKYFAQNGIDRRTKRGHDAGRVPHVKAVKVQPEVKARTKGRDSYGRRQGKSNGVQNLSPTVRADEPTRTVAIDATVKQTMAMIDEAMRSHAFVIELRRLMAKHNM